MNSENGALVVQETGTESMNSRDIKPTYSSDIRIAEQDLSTSLNDNPNGVMKLKEKPPKVIKKTKTLRKIAVVGTAESQVAAPYNDQEFEIWGLQVGLTYKTFTRYSRLYEMHIKEYWKDPVILERMKKIPKEIDIWMQEEYSEIPNSKRYPIEDVSSGFHQNFTSSIAFMLAHATYEQRKYKNIGSLQLWGVHMMAEEEYGHQRAGSEYWLGILEALGVEVFVGGTGSVLKCTFNYGYDKEWRMLSDLTTRKQQLQVGLADLHRKLEEVKSHVGQQEGAIKDVDWTIRRIQ